MFKNQFKTFILLLALSLIILFFGHLIGGKNGMTFAIAIAIIMNFGTYFFSDKIVLAMYGAKVLDRDRYGYICSMVEGLCHNANLPMPKLWLIESEMANAFATGRNPSHASVAITTGILDVLSQHELSGVLAHELSHIKNRDILIATIAATIATAIAYMADFLSWSFILGSSRDDDNRGGSWSSLLAIIFMPIAATLIQLAISRSREYLADETGAKISGDPLALASALERLSMDVKISHAQPENNAQTSTASLFIVYPFSGGSIINLFSTHPPMEKRIERLRNMVL